jgi:serine/threonine-protein kinase SRPK3
MHSLPVEKQQQLPDTPQQLNPEPYSLPIEFVRQYRFIEGVERIEYYGNGGYHPISIGDVLHGRYHVVDKLGFGGYSTTWLCRDDRTSTYVAVKIGAAHSNTREVEFLKMLPKHPLILPILESFELQGPNGTHPCYVTKPARCSIAGAKDASYHRLFQLDTARCLIVQLVKVVQFLHNEGIAHGGKKMPSLPWAYTYTRPLDLHLGNVFLASSENMNHLSVQELYDKLGQPATHPLRLENKPLPTGFPSEVIVPTWLGKRCEYFEPKEARILLADFGEAFHPRQESRLYSHTVSAYRPPEATFDPESGLSFSADIWTLGCSIWAILGQQGVFAEHFASDDRVIAEQVEAVGPMPSEWWPKWEDRLRYFDECQTPNADQFPMSIEKRFDEYIQKARLAEGMPAVQETESLAFIGMMKSMLKFRPGERLTADDILETEWFLKWGFPAYERCVSE